MLDFDNNTHELYVTERCDPHTVVSITAFPVYSNLTNTGYYYCGGIYKYTFPIEHVQLICAYNNTKPGTHITAS